VTPNSPAGPDADRERAIVPSQTFLEFAEVVGRLIAERWQQRLDAGESPPDRDLSDGACAADDTPA
jgi:hypothetical protein